MIAILFEVWPAKGKTQQYLDLATALRDELCGLDGFIAIERFESLSEPGKLLSLSFFGTKTLLSNGATLPVTVQPNRRAEAAFFRTTGFG
jgi:heme-degrading monooxygenase HmoA